MCESFNIVVFNFYFILILVIEMIRNRRNMTQFIREINASKFSLYFTFNTIILHIFLNKNREIIFRFRILGAFNSAKINFYQLA